MIVVTGGAGFVGSNLVRRLNEDGCEDIIVVDDLRDGTKFANLADCRIADYLDKTAFLSLIEEGNDFGPIEVVFHSGACSDTREWDGTKVLSTNYEYSKALLHWCNDIGAPLIYASSAAVYGVGSDFKEIGGNEQPLNLYGWSKLLFDRYVRRRRHEISCQVVGLRYFNLYGPGETHKGPMASVVLQFNDQLIESGQVRVFGGSGGFGNGEQLRDFVWVGDAVAVNLWFMKHRDVSGIFNVGTGIAHSFNEVAQAVLDFHGRGGVEYIPFPADLEGRYQSFTRADLNTLRSTGCDHPFTDLAVGVERYLEWLHRDQRAARYSPGRGTSRAQGGMGR